MDIELEGDTAETEINRDPPGHAGFRFCCFVVLSLAINRVDWTYLMQSVLVLTGDLRNIKF